MDEADDHEHSSEGDVGGSTCWHNMNDTLSLRLAIHNHHILNNNKKSMKQVRLAKHLPQLL